MSDATWGKLCAISMALCLTTMGVTVYLGATRAERQTRACERNGGTAIQQSDGIPLCVYQRIEKQ